MGSTIGAETEDPHDRSRDRGRQTGFPEQRWRVATVWELPVGRGMNFGNDLPGWANHILGNWTVAFLFSGFSQAHYTPVYSGADPSNTGRFGGRPDQRCDANGFGGTPGQLWNPACFSVPPQGVGRYGTATRGGLWGPRGWGTMLNLFKKWNLTGSERGPYFKVEAFIGNIFNRANTTQYPMSTLINDPNFGVFNVDLGACRRIDIRSRLGF